MIHSIDDYIIMPSISYWGEVTGQGRQTVMMQRDKTSIRTRVFSSLPGPSHRNRHCKTGIHAYVYIEIYVRVYVCIIIVHVGTRYRSGCIYVDMHM